MIGIYREHDEHLDFLGGFMGIFHGIMGFHQGETCVPENGR